MEGVMGIVKDMQDISADTACSLIQGLAFLPGWSEKNFQVKFRLSHACYPQLLFTIAMNDSVLVLLPLNTLIQV